MHSKQLIPQKKNVFMEMPMEMKKNVYMLQYQVIAIKNAFIIVEDVMKIMKNVRIIRVLTMVHVKTLSNIMVKNALFLMKNVDRFLMNTFYFYQKK